MTRGERISALASSPLPELEGLWEALAAKPGFDWVRAPEFASVMVRARTGGDGQPFNLGEVAVTRCSLQLSPSAELGVACVVGRSRRHAALAALLDAVSQQQDARAQRLREQISALADAAAGRRRAVVASVAASEVDFSMLLREEAS